MTTDKPAAERLQDTGRAAYAAIDEMVAALNCDYDRLAELRDEREALLTMIDDANDDEKDDARAELAQWDEENGDELESLKSEAGDCEDRDEAEERIREDALSVEVRSGWYSAGESDQSDRAPAEFNILLTTGGPAVRIRGELSGGEPYRAWLEVQDWFQPWTQYQDASQSVLLDYARCFYYGD